MYTYNMKNFIYGAIFGIVVATIGFRGVARLLDTGVNKVKNTVQEYSK